jgi:hypothetical protein
MHAIDQLRITTSFCPWTAPFTGIIVTQTMPGIQANLFPCLSVINRRTHSFKRIDPRVSRYSGVPFVLETIVDITW